MAHEITIQVDDETYGELARQAADGQLEPDAYAAQLLTADVRRARFMEAATSFADEHGAAFAEEFGTGTARTAA
ncbi:hypothetical protein [Streptomyces spectabilis]|uniref:Menaquinone-dependent protoporphyrinogen IX oxidase n=1 Tax=Streptomyces spectabilis TaxID=68270 RepID=A0A7W8B3K1_STRST|nr:hypothetical protein [Streptomyces spectabilis]MBB5109696.1 menaquinone-dependent protoporphyrinogen IX oxidase [Streptomyces spectabilis]GGV57883.1 hypothetical protein GCM10010245_91020 [Streptomyces spectabilis]